MKARIIRCLILMVVITGVGSGYPGHVSARSLNAPNDLALQAADSPTPPASPVKLVFVHHSTGGNWLADSASNDPGGDLARELMKNNYFVSATNYGWQAGDDSIGDRTDLGNWWEWFRGPNSAGIMAALYAESGQNIGDFGAWPRMEDPGGENEIVVFKSCFPNSDLRGNPNQAPPPIEDNPLRGEAAEENPNFTVANAKSIYIDLLEYFRTRPDKLFIAITAPPRMRDETTTAQAANARAFNNWLVKDWLKDYPYKNVAVFDYYNVLTSSAGSVDRNDAGAKTGNHHRWQDGAIQHIQTVDSNMAAYPSGDSHPSTAGHRKATAEFVPLLNVFYNRWKSSGSVPTAAARNATKNVEPTSTVQAAAAQETPVPLSVGGSLIQPGDLVYQGAFRLPDTDDDLGWAWSGHAMAYYPDGDASGPDDGTPGSLFATGHNHKQWVSEISIPVPVISRSKNAKELNTARTLQPFANIRGTLFDQLEGFQDFPGTLAKAGLAYLPKQGSQTTGKLYFCWGYHIQQVPQDTNESLQGQPDVSHGWSEVNLSDPQRAGAWTIDNYINFVTSDYLFPIDPAWAAANTPGKLLATGRFRDGGQGGRGPSLIAFGPWNEGNPPPPGARLSAVPLLLYTNILASDDFTMKNYSHADDWTDGAWLTAGGKSAVIFVGTKAQGKAWYGFADGTVWPEEGPFPPVPAPPNDERGWWSERFAAQIIFYNPADLAAVAQGKMKPHEPQPYATLDIDQFLWAVKSTRQRYHVGAASFDPARGVLYIIEPLVDEDKPLIHVWKVK